MSTAAPTLGETLDRWLALLDAQGFRTGVRERLLVQALLAQLAARGQAPADAAAMLALAGPLLCTSREQQRRYAVLADAFVASGAAAADKEADGSPSPPAATVAPRFGVVLALAAGLAALVILLIPAGSPAPVKPDPLLQFHYFLQRDVYGDDGSEKYSHFEGVVFADDENQKNSCPRPHAAGLRVSSRRACGSQLRSRFSAATHSR